MKDEDVDWTVILLKWLDAWIENVTTCFVQSEKSIAHCPKRYSDLYKRLARLDIEKTKGNIGECVDYWAEIASQPVCKSDKAVTSPCIAEMYLLLDSAWIAKYERRAFGTVQPVT